MNCEWSVECPENRTIFVKLLDMQLELKHAHLTIFDGNNMVVIANLTGDRPPNNLMTRTNKLLIRFRSDDSTEANRFRGFSLSYASLTAGTNTSLLITATNTVIRTYPNQTFETNYTSVTEFQVIHYDNGRKRLILFEPESQKLFVDFPDERGTALYARPDSLTFDENHGLIYWIDMQYNTINVMDLSHEMSATLLELETSSSKYLLVNTERSVLVWSDVGSEPKILQMDCDGTNSKLLYANEKQALHLTLDYQTQRYYFVDIADYSLISIDFNGNNELCLMTSRIFFDGITSMSLINSDLYIGNHQMIYKIPDLHLGIQRAEVLYTSNNLDISCTKSEFFFEIKPVNLKRSRIFSFKLIEANSKNNKTNKCSMATCDGLCLPNPGSFRCISQLLSTIPSPVLMEPQREGHGLMIFNCILMLLLIASLVLVTF